MPSFSVNFSSTATALIRQLYTVRLTVREPLGKLPQGKNKVRETRSLFLRTGLWEQVTP